MTMTLCPFGHLMSEAELEALCPQCLVALIPARLGPIGRFEHDDDNAEEAAESSERVHPCEREWSPLH